MFFFVVYRTGEEADGGGLRVPSQGKVLLHWCTSIQYCHTSTPVPVVVLPYLYPVYPPAPLIGCWQKADLQNDNMEINRNIDLQVASLRTELESLKLETIRYLAGTQ